MANKTSPDLSHILTVRAGDILPLMCFDVYGSSAYYPQVARVNGLTEFRQLTPGTQLLFPPLGAAAP
jgi:nucleoid-associated protein YgaU